MSTTESLQKLIEDRAKKRLNKDIVELGILINSQKLLRPSGVPKLLFAKNGLKDILVEHKQPSLETRVYNVSTIEALEVTRLFAADKQGYGDSPFRIWGEYLKELEEYWLPLYIQEETELFVQQVDTLQEQIDELKQN